VQQHTSTNLNLRPLEQMHGLTISKSGSCNWPSFGKLQFEMEMEPDWCVRKSRRAMHYLVLWFRRTTVFRDEILRRVRTLEPPALNTTQTDIRCTLNASYRLSFDQWRSHTGRLRGWVFKPSFTYKATGWVCAKRMRKCGVWWYPSYCFPNVQTYWIRSCKKVAIICELSLDFCI